MKKYLPLALIVLTLTSCQPPQDTDSIDNNGKITASININNTDTIPTLTHDITRKILGLLSKYPQGTTIQLNCQHSSNTIGTITIDTEETNYAKQVASAATYLEEVGKDYQVAILETITPLILTGDIQADPKLIKELLKHKKSGDRRTGIQGNNISQEEISLLLSEEIQTDNGSTKEKQTQEKPNPTKTPDPDKQSLGTQ